MQRCIPKDDQEVFDLLVVGGGIYGAAMAYFGVLNNLKVALLEKDDFCAHTSANSQKVIHGGLRYLQSLDIKRVIESIRERQRFYTLFPHLVHPLPCVLPLYGWGMKSKEAMGVAFFLYKLLQKFTFRKDLHRHSDKRPKILDAHETLRMFPSLHSKNLRGGALWYDGLCVEPERLVIALLKSAALQSAQIANYVKVTKIERLADGTLSTLSTDRLTGQEVKVKSRKIALCTGPWLKDDFGFSTLPQGLEELSLISGVNIVTEPVTNCDTSIALQPRNPDHSGLLFVLPWKRSSIGGTLWEDGGEYPDYSTSIPERIEQLNSAIHESYPSLQDVPLIQNVHFGYVPGTKDTTKPPAGRILSHYQFVDRDNEEKGDVLQVVGVKFTTAFDVSLKALAKLFPGVVVTDTICSENLPVGSLMETPELFLDSIHKKYETDISPEHITLLFSLLGSELPRIIEDYILKLKSKDTQKISYNDILKGMTCFFIQEEMVVSLPDMIHRRFFPGMAGKCQSPEVKIIAEEMAEIFNWSADVLQEEINKLHAVEKYK